ncbi:exopolysaccharide biosynthesis protein [Neomesorhizobium albiziae]|nr:exopolysaccharide biosynthesis protein [Mesorhizobium albiziae]
MRQEMRGFEDGQIDGAPVRRRPRRLSQLFAQMARDADGPVSVASIRDALGDRSFAALIVFFAALNMIPLPPPSSAILGLPLVIVAAQMMYGSKRAWLPRFVMDNSISAESFRTVMDRLIPRLISLERMIKPRYWPFWRKQGDRFIGIMIFLLAVVVTLPIPLGNWLPAFSSALLGLALIERDGILFAVGTVVGIAALAVIAAVVGSATALIGTLWQFLPI